VAGAAPVVVRVEQAAERRRSVAGRSQLLLAGLQPKRGRQRGEAQVERQELHLDASLMLLVGAGLAHAVAERIERIGEPDLVVLVAGEAVPEAPRVAAPGYRAVLALAGELGLVSIDPRLVILAVDAGNAVERVV